MPWSLAGWSGRQKVRPGWWFMEQGCCWGGRAEEFGMWGGWTRLFWAGKPKLLEAALPLHAKPGTSQRLCCFLMLSTMALVMSPQNPLRGDDVWGHVSDAAPRTPTYMPSEATLESPGTGHIEASERWVRRGHHEANGWLQSPSLVWGGILLLQVLRVALLICSIPLLSLIFFFFLISLASIQTGFFPRKFLPPDQDKEEDSLGPNEIQNQRGVLDSFCYWGFSTKNLFLQNFLISRSHQNLFQNDMLRCPGHTPPHAQHGLVSPVGHRDAPWPDLLAQSHQLHAHPRVTTEFWSNSGKSWWFLEFKCRSAGTKSCLDHCLQRFLPL